MKLVKSFYTWLAVGFLGVFALTTQSCRDDMSEENYYTFTGEMMSDFLQSHEDYSKFAEIVKRSTASKRGINIMDLISCYGQFTCFAPDNKAVDEFLKENGYPSVKDIPVDVCDTIARTHLINGVVYNTADLTGLSAIAKVNMNERYLTIEERFQMNEDGDTIDATYCLNRSGEIVMALSNDSVENGIVHTVNKVLSSSNQTLPDLMLENPDIKIINEALSKTGIANKMANKIKDDTWDCKDAKWEIYNGKKIYSGAQWDYSTVPDTRNFKFTVFACPDSILRDKYGITDIPSLYAYAQSIYGGEDYNENDEDQLKDPSNPLYRLVAYQCLPFSTTYEKFTRITSTETTVLNPCEWYASFDSLQTIKIERLTVSRYITGDDKRNDLYINRGDMVRCKDKGIHVDRTLNDPNLLQEALNGFYYTVDGLLAYSEEVKQGVFNTRIRFDMIDMFPEFMSNNLRNETPWDLTSCESPDAPARNYILPNGYLENVKVNSDGIFLYQGARSWYWSYQGDEFNLCSDNGSYDCTFQLPSVPTGTYQIRLGFCAMDSRGICQFYLDGEPKGIPFDMRSTGNFIDRTGFFELTNNNFTKDEIEAKKKEMHNLNWYHGPRGIFTTEYGKKDGTNCNKSLFCNQSGTRRYVLCTANLDENVKHTIRIKSVWAVGTALAMFDYFEIVPKSVYGVEGEGKAEDDY
ncbi:MAG: fasciclin domain-containing protein [Bacteroidales bacterium]|nr:fasciclin domain-containing protein [Bacteroidales bacterium]